MNTHTKVHSLVRSALMVIMTAGFISLFAAPSYAADELPVVNVQINAHDLSNIAIRAGDSLPDPQINTDVIKVTTFYSFPVAPTDFKGYSQTFTSFHPGYDIRANFGAEIHPVRPGTVAKVEYEAGGYGRFVVVSHENGIQTLYAHMSKTQVYEGDHVDTNDVIGYVGSTGHSTGPHIHFEVRIGEKHLNPGLILPTIKVEATESAKLAEK